MLEQSPKFHLAQVNIARMKAPIDDPVMAGFVARLDDINALADQSPGFVWRMPSGAGYLRPYDDDRILFNLSVWTSVEALKDYVYKTLHVEVMRQRNEWFQKFGAPYLALWWVPAGHVPSVLEAKQRLDHVTDHGPSAFAFTFQQPFPADVEVMEATDWRAFEPCPS